MPQKTKIPTVHGRDINTGKVIQMRQTQPLQMSLFGEFSPESWRYSNTIELFDAIPKYFSSSTELGKERNKIIKDKIEKKERPDVFLPTVTRTFRHKTPGRKNTEQRYIVKIRPARLEMEDGSQQEFFPGQREQAVEAALRKIACRDGGMFLNEQAGVSFTLNALNQELKFYHKEKKHDDLVMALKILAGTELTLTLDGESTPELQANILPILVRTNRDDYIEDPTSKCYAQFNPLVTASINDISYRQFDYETYMSLKSAVARWLFIRMAHNFRQASAQQHYSITAKRVISDSYLANNREFRHRIGEIDKAWDELKEKGVVFDVDAKREIGPRNTILDSKYTVCVSQNFIDETVFANTRNQGLVTRLESYRETA